MTFNNYLADSLSVIEKTSVSITQNQLDDVINVIVNSFKLNSSLLICGNGGSAADAMHIAGELVARFLIERKALKVISLVDNPAVITAWSNDYSYETLFARQVEAYGDNNSILLGISTSGNSKNIILAFEKAKELGVKTIAMTGEGGGKLASLSDYLLAVPSKNTPLIQQAHICLYHYLCMEIEKRMIVK